MKTGSSRKSIFLCFLLFLFLVVPSLVCALSSESLSLIEKLREKTSEKKSDEVKPLDQPKEITEEKKPEKQVSKKKAKKKRTLEAPLNAGNGNDYRVEYTESAGKRHSEQPIVYQETSTKKLEWSSVFLLVFMGVIGIAIFTFVPPPILTGFISILDLLPSILYILYIGFLTVVMIKISIFVMLMLPVIVGGICMMVILKNFVR